MVCSLGHSLIYLFLCSRSFIYLCLWILALKRFICRGDSILGQNVSTCIFSLHHFLFRVPPTQTLIRTGPLLSLPSFLLPHYLCHLDTSDGLCLRRLLTGLGGWDWPHRTLWIGGRCKVAPGSKRSQLTINCREYCKYLRSQPREFPKSSFIFSLISLWYDLGEQHMGRKCSGAQTPLSATVLKWATGTIRGPQPPERC